MVDARSPLDAVHRALGAKIVPFGGWEMPLSYPTGTLAEHMACRTSAAVFDVSHLGTVRLDGPGAAAAVQATFTADLTRVGPGRAQYTHLLDDAGGVADDVIVWWRSGAFDDPGGQLLDVMPNASNTSGVRAALRAAGAEAVDVTAERVVLAVQGPAARRILATVAPEAAAVPRFRVATCTWRGVPWVVAGTGYTGEDGVELAVPVEAGAEAWDALVAAGAVPAGLGARDTLRLEAGLPLHGHELGPGISPLQAGLGWVVGWDKGDFPGRAALAAERAAGPARRLRGILLEGRRPPREGQGVRAAGGAPAGVVTSGNFSPVLGRGIALALLEPHIGPGSEVEVDLRGTWAPGRVVRPPFVGPGGTPPPADAAPPAASAAPAAAASAAPAPVAPVAEEGGR